MRLIETMWAVLINSPLIKRNTCLSAFFDFQLHLDLLLIPEFECELSDLTSTQLRI